MLRKHLSFRPSSVILPHHGSRPSGMECKYEPENSLHHAQVLFVPPSPVHPHIYSNGHICLDILYDGMPCSNCLSHTMDAFLSLSFSSLQECACSCVKYGLVSLLHLLLASQVRDSHAVIGMRREEWGMEPGADNQQIVLVIDVHASQQHRAGALTYIWLIWSRSMHLTVSW